METKVKLSNGIEFIAEDRDGSYVTDKRPAFPAGIFGVELLSDTRSEKLDQVRLVECFSVDGRYWFNFLPLSEQEKRIVELENALCEISIGG